MRAILLGVMLALVATVSVPAGDEKPADSAKAKKTRDMLKTKYTLDIAESDFRDVVESLKEEVKGLRIKVDTKAGINLNKRMSYKCKEKELSAILEELLGKHGWGYYVVSNAKDSQWDGAIWIRPGKERGYPGAK